MSPPTYTEVVAGQLRSQPEPGVVVRVARTARDWSQAELGRRCGYSASQVSRWETGRLPLRDVTLLRTLADVLGVPASLFGLDNTSGRAHASSAAAGPRVGPTTIPAAEEDPVRRRAFLQLVALTGSSLALPSPGGAARGADPAQVLAGRLGDVLLGPPQPARPAPVAVLAKDLAGARREFTACSYLPLASRLPALIAAAEVTAADRLDAAASQMLAESYNLTTRALIKMEASGLEWLSADRAVHAARAGENALTLAESQRLVASVARRAGHHDRAQSLTLAAADQLEVRGPRPAPAHLAMYGTLYLSAAYAAARAGDRERAADLLTEANATARRLVDDPHRHRSLVANLVSHQVSAAYLLGDVGAALAHARTLPLAMIPTTERRARLLVDTAQAWARWDKPTHAYRALLAAERTAPGEVRTRTAARRLVVDLMAAPRQSTMPGLPALAHRVHAIA